MKDYFEINSIDGYYTAIAKREANIKLASLHDSVKNNTNVLEVLQKTIELCEVLDSISLIDKSHYNDIFNSFKNIYEKGLLTPLTLKDDEFGFKDIFGDINNIRYPSIYKHDNKVYNRDAYKAVIRASYSHKDNIQIKVPDSISHDCDKIYIGKGGVVTTEYIDKCEIRPDIVEKGYFNINSIVKIPVSWIIDGYDEYLVVDHKDPKLKALKEFYNVITDHDEPIKGKYDIRKYEKLIRKI